MYSISAYGQMIADKERMEAYAQALRQITRPDSVVLDLGAGTGIFTLLACQYGARKVYAIEPNDSIKMAEETAVANGFRERIEFIQDLSTKVSLPEQANIIISDLRGVLPLFDHHIPSIMDARRRLLAPGGVLIPQCDSLWAAVVEAPELYKSIVEVWDANGYGFKMDAALQIVTNTWTKGRVKLDQLLTEPKCWATLNYSTIECSDISAEVCWTVTRSGFAHGLCIWFDTLLAEGVGFSNAPDAPDLIYGRAFFPWSKPVSLTANDIVRVTLQAKLVAEDYIWCWETRVLNEGQPEQINADFKQSTFFGAPLSPSRLRKQADIHVPCLKEEGQIDRFILGLMDGQTPLGQIARQLCDRFPLRFSNFQSALTRAGELSQKYSQ